MSNKLRSWVILVVTIVWGANMVAPIFKHDYTQSPELNVAFMAILGILTATYKTNKKDDGDDEAKS